jgi:hypothetical protein
LGGGWGAAAALGTAPLSIPVLFGAGLTAGMMTGGAEFSFEIEAGLAFDEFLNFKDELGQPIDPNVAKMAAIGAGALNAGLEVVGLGILAKSIPGVDKLTGGIARDAIKEALRAPTVRQALAESATLYGGTLAKETAVEVAQRFFTLAGGELAKFASGQNIDQLGPAEWASDLTHEALSAVQTFSLLSAPGPALQFAGDARRAKQAAQNEQFFQALGQGVTGSKTFERQPQAAQEFIARATKDGPIENLYAPIDTWTTYWQGKGLDPASMAAELTGNPNAYAEAKATGVDLQIPTASYAVKLAGTEHNTFFAQELRLQPEAMNARESKEFIAEQEAAAAEAAAPAKAEAVRETLLRELQMATAGTGIQLPPGALERYADAYQAILGTWQEELGIDPVEFLERYGLEVRGPQEKSTPQTTLEQPERGAPNVDDLDKAVAAAAGVPNIPDSAREALEREGFVVDTGQRRRESDTPAELARAAKTGGGNEAMLEELRAEGVDPSRGDFGAVLKDRLRTVASDPKAVAGGRAMMRRLGDINAAREAAPPREGQAQPDAEPGEKQEATAAAEAAPDPAQPTPAQQAQQLLEQNFPQGSTAREELVNLRRTSSPADFKQFLADVFTPTAVPAPNLHVVGGERGPEGLAWGTYVASLRELRALYTQVGQATELADPQVAELEADLGDASIELVDDDIQENASGESAASQEALSRGAGMRARGEQFVVFNRAGEMRPLIGPDAVDYRTQPGETYGVQGPEGFRPLEDRGGRVTPQPVEIQAPAAAPGEELFLDWDRPASQQPMPVQQALRALGIRWTRGNDPIGGDIYRSLSKATEQDPTGASEASRALHTYGVLGTRYSDAGAPNYVAFDKNLGPVELWQGERPKGFDVIAQHLTPAERDKLKRDHAERMVALFKELPADQDFSDAALAGIAKRGWYKQSAAAIREIFGNVDGPRFAALLAAMSPQTSVESNLYNAVNTWKNWVKAGRPTDRKGILKVMARSVQGSKGVDSVLASWVPNTVRALSADEPMTAVLSGPKVHSFYRNLIGEMNEVTNDAWMSSFALVDKAVLGGSINKAETDPGKGPGYLAMVAKIRRVAKKLSETTGETWTPAEVQETVWSWAKTLYELAEAEGTDAETIVREGRLTDQAIASTPDFKTLFTTDPTVRSILEAAGYGDAISALETELGRSADRGDERAGTVDAGAGAAGRPATLGTLRSARRLDALRRQRQEAARLKEGTELRQELRPAFYSRILETINQSQTAKATGAQWKATIRNSKLGTSKDEYALTQVDDLEDGRSYTREEVLQYLRTHRVAVSQVILGEGIDPALEERIQARADEIYDEKTREELDQALDYAGLSVDVEAYLEEIEDIETDDEGNDVEVSREVWRVKLRHGSFRRGVKLLDEEFDSLEEAEAAGERAREDEEDSIRQSFYDDYEYSYSMEDAVEAAREELEDEDQNKTHYQDYVLKGFTETDSYREAFVVAEEGRPARVGHALEHARVANAVTALENGEWVDVNRALDRAETDHGSSSNQYAAALQAMQEVRSRMNEMRNKLRILEEQNAGTWVDGHQGYDHIERPIVRLRFNARSGYLFDQLEAARQGEARFMSDIEAQLERERVPKQRIMFLEEVQPPQPANFDVMPQLFQKNWREVAFKWALRYAAEHNFGAIAWTTGRTQQDRYSLRKEVNSISWTTEARENDKPSWSLIEGDSGRQVTIETLTGGTIQVLVDPSNGMVKHAVGRAAHWVDEHLSSIMGSELADQVLKSDTGTIEGEGLEVGGVGLAKLYDVDFRNVVNNLPAVKKSKAKVTRLSIGDVGGGGAFRVVGNARMISSGNAQLALFERGTAVPGFLSLYRVFADAEHLARWREERKEHYDNTDEELDDRYVMVERPTFEIDTISNSEEFDTEIPTGHFLWGGEWYFRQWHIQAPDRRTVRATVNIAEAQAIARARNEALLEKDTTQLPQGIAITPELKAAVLGGQYLFQPQRGDGGSFDSPSRGNIRFGPNRQFTITLFKDADVSTFMHESAHLFLEMMQDLASADDAKPRIVADMEVLRNWFFPGGTGTETIGVREHEMFARAFERYLMEGKAPSVGLRGLFNQFRAWLMNLYRQLAELDVELTDDVRGVFDRMFATDRAILEAQAEFTVTPMFTTAESAGMSPEEFGRYQATIEEASRKARETLEAKLLQEVRRAQTAAWRAQADDTRREVAAEVHQQPVYQALAAMRRGTRPDGSPIVEGVTSEPLRLSRQIIVDRYGEDRLRALPRPYIYSTQGGLDPDVVAQMFGFSSGDAMLQAVVAAPPMNQAIEQTVDQRMRERYGDLVLENKIPDEAKAALANDQRDAIIRAELRALGQLRRTVAPFEAAAAQELQAEQRERTYERRWFEAEARLRIAIAEGRKQAEIDELRNEVMNLRRRARGGAATVRAGIPADSVLRDAARARIGRTRIRDIKPATFWSAARRSSQKATELAAGQDFDGAIVEKQNELINLALYRQASQAKDEADKRVRQLMAFSTPAARSRLGLAGQDYLDQVDAILDRYDLGRASQKALDRRQALRAWVEQLQAQGLPVEIPSSVLDDARRIHYSELTVDELAAVADGVNQIAHLARLKNSLLKKRKQRDFQAAVEEIATSIRNKARKLEKRLWGSRLPQDEALHLLEMYFAAHRKMSSLARELDGFEDGGAVWEYIIQPLNEAADQKAVRTAAAAKALHDIVDAAYVGREKLKLYDKTHIPEIGASLTKMERIMVALNWGNEGNRQRLMRGHGLNENQVRVILDTLDQRDWTFVQGVWDHIDSYWQEIADKQRRVTGLAPEKVEAVAVKTKFGEMRGGYFPVKWDGRISPAAQKLLDVEQAKLAVAGAYVSSTTRRGHTVERADQVGPEFKLRLDFNVIFEHVNQVIHDLTHHETLIDVNRILGSAQVRDAIYEAAGDSVYSQFKNGIKAVASGDVAAVEGHERAINHIRTGTTVAMLGWSLSVPLLQPIGLTQSVQRIGGKWVARGMMRWLKDASTMENTVKWITAKSDFMRMRGQTQLREINEIRNQIGVNTGKVSGYVETFLNTVTANKVTQAGMADSFFYLVQQAQRIADVPTWLGQYEKSMAAGETEERAIQLADQAVIDSQGSGYIKDLAAVQRGPAAWKLWTNFYSFFSTTYQLSAEATARSRYNRPGAIGRLAVDYMLLFIIPATLSHLVREGMKGEEDDDKNLLVELARANVAYLSGTMMGLREMGGAIQGYNNYEGPAGAALFARASRLIGQVQQGELDEALWRATLDTAGILFHFPSGQARRTIEGIVALIEGRTTNPGALVSGPPKE